jgi:hypothetical protein
MGSSVANVTIARYALGLLALALVAGSIGLTAVAARRRLLPSFTGAPARLAEAVIGLATLTAVLEALGTVHLFRLGPIVAACVLLAAATKKWLPGSEPPSARVKTTPDVCSLVAVLAIAALTAEWAAPTLQSYNVGIRTLDSLWYHLPWAASFAQTGQITSLRFTDVEYLTAFYPATAELYHGLGIVLLGRDTLSPLLNLGFLGLTVLAGYCVGRPTGRGQLTALGTMLALALPAIASSQAGSAANDIVGVCFLLAAVALYVNEAPLLAVLALGLAIATKLSMLAPAAALLLAMLVTDKRTRRPATALLLIAAGGYWYARNLIAVGNPLPWIDLGFTATPAAPLQQHTGFAVAHYLTATDTWTSTFGPGLKAGLGRVWPAIVAAAIIGPLLCLRQRTTRVLGFTALVALLAYIVTPESAAGPDGHPLGFAFNLRYAAPALTLGLTILPLATPRKPTAGILAALLALTLIWPPDHVPGALAVGLLAAGATIAAAHRVKHLGWVALAAAAIIGYPWQDHYLKGRYTFQPGVSYLSRTWAYFRPIHGARVGLVGTFGGFFSYPLYGVDDSNRVSYIAHRRPHGSFTPITTCPAWRTAVNAGHFRYVVTTPARDPWQPKLLQPSPEQRWTATDPAARAAFVRKAPGRPPVTVWELSGRLDPGRCPVPAGGSGRP